MITSIRYRGFSFYYKDNDNKYKEIFDEILAYNFKTVKVLRNIDDTKVSLIDTKYGRYVFKVFAPKTKRNERFLKSFVKGDYYQNLIVETDRVRSAGLTFPNDFYFLAERKARDRLAMERHLGIANEIKDYGYYSVIYRTKLRKFIKKLKGKA
ncbi:lipopolysaccharide core heptose(II) kinase RfaY [Escherichia coli]